MTHSDPTSPVRISALFSRAPAAQKLTLPGLATTLRIIEATEKTNRTIIFYPGLLGDSHTWDHLNRHEAPWRYANCYYIDFNFDTKREPPPTFPVLALETELLMKTYCDPGKQRATLVANSLGGHLALFQAVHRRVEPLNLVLFSPGGIREVAIHRSKLSTHRTIDKILDVSFDRIFNDPGVALRPDLKLGIRLYREQLEPKKRVYGRNMLHLARSVRESILTNENLRQIRTPTVLIWGSRDKVAPPDVCQVMLDHIPQSRVVWVNSGHAPHIESPEICSKVLRDIVVGESAASPQSTLRISTDRSA